MQTADDRVWNGRHHHTVRGIEENQTFSNVPSAEMMDITITAACLGKK
jgi:hypothetical protein